MRFSNRRRMAASMFQGKLVAARTSTPSCELPTPCICTRNSVLIRRALSLSLSDRALHNESISSRKMMAGLLSLANSNIPRTSFSLSPRYFETRSEEAIERKHESASVATALARYDLPVPGGPYKRIPLHGLRLPVKSWGNRMGRITASLRDSFATSSPATSSQWTFGFSLTIALMRFPFILSRSPSSSSPPPAAATFFFGWGFSKCSFNFSARSTYLIMASCTRSFRAGTFSYLTASLKYSRPRRYRSYASR
mmetsp:Transcript_126276/g.188443  ORF Transcript_126276/g.188443 Transcript_126276/m.188443 type:complete len:253 (-) Transcript_126276:90-848(-)